MTARVEATLDVSASVEDVFAAMVDLRAQDKWILATKLFALEGDIAVPHVGSKIAALTGVAGIGVLDTMTVTVYQPPHLLDHPAHRQRIQGNGHLPGRPAPGRRAE